MSEVRSMVSVVDDDESLRESLPGLLRELGFDAVAFSSAAEYLASDHHARTQCLILDIRMPGMTGPALLRELSLRGSTVPIIFITAHPDDGVRSVLLDQGAVECLFKPFTAAALLGALRDGLGTS
jgi:FixJ family two-component response regulator